MTEAQQAKEHLTQALKDFEAAMTDMFGPRADTGEASDIKPSPLAFALAMQFELMVHFHSNTMTINKARVIQLEMDRAAST